MALKQLIIMRHGEAEMEAPSDMERALTTNGEQQVRESVKELVKTFKEVDLCLVSPYRRAQETARIAGRILHIRGFEDSELITPDADCTIATERLGELFGIHDTMIVVSHMPFVAGLVNYLAGEREEPVFGFVPAEIICMKFEVFGENLGSIKRLS